MTSVSFDPLPAEESDVRRRAKIERNFFPVGVGIFLMGGAIVSTVVNFLGNGGRSPEPSLIPVPAWPFWIIVFAPLYSIIASWRLLDSGHRWLVFAIWIYSGSIFTMFPVGFARVYVEPNGIVVAGERWGWQWLAAPVGALSFLLTTIRFVSLQKSTAPVVKRRDSRFDFKTKAGRVDADNELRRITELMKTPAGVRRYMEEIRLEAQRRETEGVDEIKDSTDEPGVDESDGKG